VDSEERIRGAILRALVKRGLTNPGWMKMMREVKLESEVGSGGLVITEKAIQYDPFAIASLDDFILGELCSRAVYAFAHARGLA